MRQYSLYRCLALKHSPESGQYIKEIDSCLAVYPQIHSVFVEEDKILYLGAELWRGKSYGRDCRPSLPDLDDSGYKDAALV